MSPAPRLLAAVAGVAAIAAAGTIWPSLASVGLAAELLVLLVAVADAVRTARAGAIDVVREAPDVLSVGAANPIRLRLRSRGRRPLLVELTDEPPAAAEAAGLPARVELRPWTEVELVYHVVPRRRGPARFGAVHLRYPSPLGLWSRLVVRPLEHPVRVFPDIRAVRRFDLLARKNRLAEMGLRMWRLRGREGEFERLREYRREDEPRHIDWKATAKHGRLIAREFTVERNQNVVVLLDCGRSMRTEVDGLSHLDRGLNAAIILSYIALEQGDHVSLVAFSHRIERVVGPLRGRPAIRTLIRGTFDLEPRLDASDYELACESLLRRQKKRALVVLLTHAADEAHVTSIGRALRGLATPHLFLVVFLRDLALAALASARPDTDRAALHAAAAAEILAAQAHHVAALREAGILVLEAAPTELAAGIVNEYLDIKARHRL